LQNLLSLKSAKIWRNYLRLHGSDLKSTSTALKTGTGIADDEDDDDDNDDDY